MEKYARLFKGLELCAKPDCSAECPYHGETRGGKTCRAWLLTDAAAALAGEESRAEELAGECAHLRELCDAEKPKVAPVALGAVEGVVKLIKNAEYWRGRADALAEIVARCSFGGGTHE